MTKKNYEIYECIRASKYYKSGEWFTLTDLASQLGHHGINAKSVALYLANLRDEGEIEMGVKGGGSYRIWRKQKGLTPHLPLRVAGGYTNDELGIPDASKEWH